MSANHDFKVVKHSNEKVDLKSLVLGKPVFTDDMAPANALVVKLLRSPHAHARIRSIDCSLAREMDDVECVLTHEDLPRIPFTRAGQGAPEPSPYDAFLLDKKVRFVGDVVAVVAARDEKAANRALKKIQVDYEVLEPLLDFRKAMEGNVVLHDEKEAENVFDPTKNIAAHYTMEIGETDRLIEESEVKVDVTYYYPKSQQVPLEPHAAFAYLDEKSRLVVVSSTQVPFHARRILSRILQLPPGKIRVIKPRIGGGFGAKQGVIIEGYVAAVTWKTGKPARLVLSREESLIGTYTRHDTDVRVRLGADKTGKLNALDMYVLSNTGAYGDHALTVAMVCGSKTLPLYNKVQAVRFSTDVVYTNLPNAGAYRGYGAPQGLLALDGALDELAQKLDMDPLYIKERNSIREKESSPIFQIMGEGREGVEQIVQSCKLDDCIAQGKELFGWQVKREQFGLAHPKDGKVRGVGCALAMQGSGIPKVDMASATIKMNDDGSFNLLVGATDLGTGSDTVLSQIAAEMLQVPLEMVHIYSSDTDTTPFDVGAYASSTTYVSGNAVWKTAKKVKEHILQAAAELFDCDVAQLHIQDQGVHNSSTGESISYAQLCTQLFYTFNQRQIAATESFVGDESPMPFMASFMEIEVDLRTGEVHPVETVSVVDCGTPINPKLALGQVEGATLQGLGTAFFEELTFDSRGKPTNASLFRYKIFDRASYGKITARLVESYEPTGPFGAKSVSEIGIDTPTVALLNALFHATGIRFRSLPVRPETILKALKGENV
ncbi:MAG TPA: molybdopterin-dependent oxidoreductase [Thermotogota bacterium]|nr:molybdopterin-dependent oxidoreductase [Thermotogota bacterium]HRW93178.1 molybdopterin-dependent oxidoreductase [Thermotogota bacterium]